MYTKHHNTILQSIQLFPPFLDKVKMFKIFEKIIITIIIIITLYYDNMMI